MATEIPRARLEVSYYHAAQEYLRSLPLEHFMEATPQATQRKITLASLELVHALWAAFQVFNELLVQYPLRGKKKPGQVVPDNMVVVHEAPIEAEGSYDVPLQPAGPYWVLEYVSKSSKRKDYDDNMEKYERQLKVPYYLIFYPDNRELTLYRHNKRRYVTVKPNEQGRYAIPELEMEVALLDGWVRFWFRGELLPLPADLLRQLEQARHDLQETQRDLQETRHDLQESQRDLQETRGRLQGAEEEVARLRAELDAARRKPAK
jgi:hypothetical protein